MQYIKDRSIAPEKHSFNPEFFGIESLMPVKTVFSNGIPCYQINKGSQELVKIEFIFDAGTSHQTKKFSSFSVFQLLTEGTLNFTSAQISEIFDFYGAHIEKEIDRDFASVSVYCLNKYLDKILPLLKEIICFPVFPEHEIEIFKKKQISQLIINQEKVNFVARTKFSEILFGKSHPYGAVAEIPDIENININDLKNFHHQYLSSVNCKILVSGKINDKIISDIEAYFGMLKWGNSEKLPFNFPEILNIDAEKHYIHKEKAVQSAIRIGQRMFNFHHPDYFRFQLLNTVLGGYFGSRLMKNIREDKAYTYGIGSAVLPLKHSGYFFVSTEVGAENTKKAIDEIYHEMDVLTKDIISDEELNLVKNYKYGEFIRSIDGAFAIAESLKPLIMYNLEFDYYTKYLNSIQNTTPENLLQIAEKYFKFNNFIELVVGKN